LLRFIIILIFNLYLTFLFEKKYKNDNALIMGSNIVQKIPQFKNDENKALNFFKEYGFHIENAVYSEDECDNLIKQSFNFQNFINTTYIPEQQIHKKNKMVMDMMKKNKMVDIIKKFASNSIEMFGVQSTFFYGVPGTSGSASHQDSLWVKPEDANGFISAWTPLVDLEEDNMGNLFVYEKSHRYGDLEVVEKKQYNKKFQNEGLAKYESVLKENLKKHHLFLKKGSTVFLHSNVVHGSITNNSSINRNAILFTYIRDGLSFREGNEAKREKTALK
jgi:ectoine hydroxylase-related dioxygenase (phytanoyl-CoA dioxygenase family)